MQSDDTPAPLTIPRPCILNTFIERRRFAPDDRCGGCVSSIEGCWVAGSPACRLCGARHINNTSGRTFRVSGIDERAGCEACVSCCNNRRWFIDQTVATVISWTRRRSAPAKSSRTPQRRLYDVCTTRRIKHWEMTSNWIEPNICERCKFYIEKRLIAMLEAGSCKALLPVHPLTWRGNAFGRVCLSYSGSNVW